MFYVCCQRLGCKKDRSVPSVWHWQYVCHLPAWKTEKRFAGFHSSWTGRCSAKLLHCIKEYTANCFDFIVYNLNRAILYFAGGLLNLGNGHAIMWHVKLAWIWTDTPDKAAQKHEFLMKVHPLLVQPKWIQFLFRAHINLIVCGLVSQMWAKFSHSKPF